MAKNIFLKPATSGGSGDELTVSNINIGGVSVSDVHTIEFDENTGLNVTNPATGVARIALGSHWRDLVIDGQPTLSPTGEETLRFIAGDNITLTTNDVSVPKSITISATGGGGTGVNGSVFITNVAATGEGNITNITLTDGVIINSFMTNTNLVTFTILALPGNTTYKPNILINGLPVTVTADPDKPLFNGTIAIDLAGETSITVTHEDGASHTVNITYDTLPIIEEAVFTGGYPGTQTELKSGDIFNFYVRSNENVDRIEFSNYGAYTSQTITVSSGMIHTVSPVIANRGNITQDLGARVRVRKPNGSWSDWHLTENDGSADGVNLVKLNNTHPTLAFQVIDYPATQSAIKNSETAVVNNTATNFDVITYDSPTSELTINNVNTYETAKTVTRASGTYNITTNNFRVTAIRTANDATSVSQIVVFIAHVAPSISITFPSRLRSGGNDGTSAQNHTITITSNQQLIQAPTLTAPIGTWQGSGFAGGPLIWTRSIQIHDNMTKGTYTWQDLSSVNLAGVVQTNISSGSQYILGGFVSRNLTLNAFENETTMNVEAVTYTNVTLTWTVKSLPNRRAVGTTTTPDPNSWCLHTLNTNPTIVRILDTAATESSSQATIVTVQESI